MAISRSRNTPFIPRRRFLLQRTETTELKEVSRGIGPTCNDPAESSHRKNAEKNGSYTHRTHQRSSPQQMSQRQFFCWIEHVYKGQKIGECAKRLHVSAVLHSNYLFKSIVPLLWARRRPGDRVLPGCASLRS